ncbi:hypothetical protein [Gryllotalpicola ginsengisoli]|uniref:hypothetical protein n=1 Tax=Gryllotalpicola ginsengisoli TaxID=444608 RepID=UPI00040A7D79|nr:hypothetical protein [Gryllotalpicola ginsengisoli]
MTSETGKKTPTAEVQRARAELVAALSEFEDKINVPKRIRRFKAEAPQKFYAVVGTAGTVAAGLVALGVLAIVKRR